jgi:hypothetical protein
LEFYVYAVHKFAHDEYIGEVREIISSPHIPGPTCEFNLYLNASDMLIEPPIAINRKLRKYGTNGFLHELQAVIELTITCTAPSRCALEYQMDDALHQAKDASGRVHPVVSNHTRTGVAADYLRSVAVTSISISKTLPWESFLNKVQMFTKIVDQLAEVQIQQLLSISSHEYHSVI